MSNVTTLKRPSAVPTVVWWEDKKQLALLARTHFKDCNIDEFDQAVAVARELNLSPLRKQIYAFVFNKTDEKKRNMVLVVSIDGARAIAARHENYRPANEAPKFVVDETRKNPLSNPEGLVSVEVCAFMYSHGDWHKVVGEAYWDEHAPLVRAGGDDDYEYVDTGETWEDSGKPKKNRRLKEGASTALRLDPKKDGWRKMPRLMLAKCAEMAMLRRGWPEDLSRVYAEEETHQAATLDDVEYQDLTPSEMVKQAQVDERQARIGSDGPAIFVIFDEDGTLDRVPSGQFADRVMEWLGKPLLGPVPDRVAKFVEQNKVALREFWAFNATDALKLKEVLEERSKGATVASPPMAPQTTAGTTSPAESPKSTPPKAGEVLLSKAQLLASVAAMDTVGQCTDWANNHDADMNGLSDEDRDEVERAYERRSGDILTAKSKKK